MALVVKEDSSVVYDDHQFVQLGTRNIGEALATFHNYGEIASAILGSITPAQASGLGSLSITSIVPLYLNLPNCNRATFYGINNAVAKRFVSRNPVMMESYQVCHQIKAELAQWNPSFTETALLTALTFINGYSGNDPTVRNVQQQMSNASNLILWKLSNGNVDCFEQLRFRFFAMMKLLQQAKVAIFSALESSSKNSYVLGNLCASMHQAETNAEMLIESRGIDTLND